MKAKWRRKRKVKKRDHQKEEVGEVPFCEASVDHEEEKPQLEVMKTKKMEEGEEVS